MPADEEDLPVIAAPALEHPCPLPGEPSGLRNCGWCGASDMTAALQVALWDTGPGGPLARCKSISGCVERWLAQEDARAVEAEVQAAREAVERAAIEAAAEVPAEAPEPVAAKPVRRRTSGARKAALDAAKEKPAPA